MTSIINITPGSLMSVGSTIMCTSDKDRLGSTLIGLGTSLSTGALTINVHATDVETTKSYVESLSEEEINQMLNMLDEREVIINDGNQKLTLKY